MHTTLLELARRTARTWIVAPEFLDEMLVTVNDARAPLDPRLGWESSPSFTRPLEKRSRLLLNSYLPYDLVW